MGQAQADGLCARWGWAWRKVAMKTDVGIGVGGHGTSRCLLLLRALRERAETLKPPAAISAIARKSAPERVRVGAAVSLRGAIHSIASPPLPHPSSLSPQIRRGYGSRMLGPAAASGLTASDGLLALT